MEIQVELRLRVSLCVVGGAPHYVKLKYITNPATPKWILLAGWQRKVGYKNWKEKKNKRIVQGCPTGVCHAKLTPKNGDKYWTFMISDLPSSLDTQKCSTVFFQPGVEDLRRLCVCANVQRRPRAGSKRWKDWQRRRLVRFHRVCKLPCWLRAQHSDDAGVCWTLHSPLPWQRKSGLSLVASSLLAGSRLWNFAPLIKCEATRWT